MSRIEEVEKLIDTFKMERVIYVILTSVSAVTLIGLGLYMAIAQQNIEGFIALLVPSGTLTLCIFRVLKMWDDALKFISNDNNHES
ncbi:hypothetical protein [Kaistella palustris]|uniref:hypothetical protein n=1 Tax=Kaistella palustris TaxID=493376 RepID=UPI0003F66A0E|nr:hypothetical protein [Kaistella palustris]